MWFSQQAFPDISSSRQEVESHTSIAQSFKCDQGRAQENISLLNIEQHCLVVWYLGWSWYLWYMIPGAVKRWLNAEEQLRKPYFFIWRSLLTAQFLQPCPEPLGKRADERLELPWWSSQFSGPVLIHFSFDETCFRSACSFLLLRNYQQLTKFCRLPLMTSFVPV